MCSLHNRMKRMGNGIFGLEAGPGPTPWHPPPPVENHWQLILKFPFPFPQTTKSRKKLFYQCVEMSSSMSSNARTL